MIKMTLEQIMKIRHSGNYYSNGGIFFNGNKFIKTVDRFGWFNKKLPVEKWEEIEVIEANRY